VLQPSSLLSRTLALVMLALALLGGARLVVAPLLAAFQDNASRIEEAEVLLQRYRALAEQRPTMADRIAAQQEFAASAAGYLQGPSDALAAAQLQDRVKSVIEGAGGELHSTQILPARAMEGVAVIRRAALRVQFEVTIEGLAETLYELETGQPCLLIDQLSVREQRTRRLDEAELRLDVGLELSGYLHAERSEPPAGSVLKDRIVFDKPLVSMNNGDDHCNQGGGESLGSGAGRTGGARARSQSVADAGRGGTGV
jgi:general secretion pathway protein M